jgi:hypothetical protein
VNTQRVSDAWTERIVSGEYGGATWAEIRDACADLLDARAEVERLREALHELAGMGVGWLTTSALAKAALSQLDAGATHEVRPVSEGDSE